MAEPKSSCAVVTWSVGWAHTEQDTILMYNYDNCPKVSKYIVLHAVLQYTIS